MTGPYAGLVADDWAWIDEGVDEALAVTGLPLQFRFVADQATPGAMDALYSEAATADGEETWTDWCLPRGWVRFNPENERLQKLGLRTNVDLLVLIPSAERKRIEAILGGPFVPSEVHTFVLFNKVYNVQQVREDTLPLWDFPAGTLVGSAAVGYILTASTKPL